MRLAHQKSETSKLESAVDSSSFQMMNISETEFTSLSHLIYEKFGINLTEQKRLLLVGRLQKVIKLKGFRTFQEYYDHLIRDQSGKALEELAIKVSTNHTFFYRESDHFELFENTVLPELVENHKARNNYDIRIWSAGCSSGEEPYTLAMLMLRYFGVEYSKWSAGILATDISTKMLEHAMIGEYSKDRLDLLPKNLRDKFFIKLSDDRYSVCDQLKKEVVFRKLNLMNEKFPFRKQFDLIFCRNVMIYFDERTREELVKRLYENLVTDGYLFIGHSESLRVEKDMFKFICPAVYRKGQKNEQ